MVFIPFGDFAPDQVTLYNSGVAPVGFAANNCWPMPDGSDAPLRARNTSYSAVGAAPLGYFAYSDAHWFAGSAAKLWKLNFGTGAWADVAGAAYTATRWRFANFGDRVVAVDKATNPQVYQVGVSAAFADLAAAAPKARFVATVEPGFLMLGDVNDGTDKPNYVRWSAINDCTSWPTLGTAAAAAAQSDEQQLPLGGNVKAILPGVGGAAAIVLMERAIYRVEYVGAPSIFSFRPVITGIGCAAPDSAIVAEGIAYFYSHDGLYGFDGTSLKRIGEGRVNRWVRTTMLDPSGIHNTIDLTYCFAGHDNFRKVIVWTFSAYQTSGFADFWLLYNYHTDRWRYASVNSNLNVTLMGTAKFPTTESVVAFGTTAGTYKPFIYDDTTQTTLAAVLETADTDAGPGSNRRLRVLGIRPITDAPVDTSIVCAVGFRDNLATTVSYSGATSPGRDGICPQRKGGRYVRARFRVIPGAEWTYAKGVDVLVVPRGTR